jgi:hypothetical protein
MKIGKKKTRENADSGTLAQDCGKYVHQLSSFARQAISVYFHRRIVRAIQQSKPVGRFFRFLAAGLNSQEEILLTNRLVPLDVISAHRSGRSDKLFQILQVCHGPRELLDERTNFLREPKSSFFQIIRLRIFSHFLDSICNCFEFRYSNFEFFYQ